MNLDDIYNSLIGDHGVIALNIDAVSLQQIADAVARHNSLDNAWDKIAISDTLKTIIARERETIPPLLLSELLFKSTTPLQNYIFQNIPALTQLETIAQSTHYGKWSHFIQSRHQNEFNHWKQHAPWLDWDKYNGVSVEDITSLLSSASSLTPSTVEANIIL